MPQPILAKHDSLISMTYVFPYVEEAKDVLIQVAPGMPPEYWWVTGIVLVILILTVTIDAFTANIPEMMILLGLLSVALTQCLYVSTGFAANNLIQALASGLLLWAINFAWSSELHYDVIGMVDVNWTMLAVACFGFSPVVFAWGLGAVLALALFWLMKLINYRITEVTFSPFLLIGLSLGLFFVRFW